MDDNRYCFSERPIDNKKLLDEIKKLQEQVFNLERKIDEMKNDKKETNNRQAFAAEAAETRMWWANIRNRPDNPQN